MKGLETLDTQQKDIIRKGTATHVVTAILYGANAFFVFDSEKLEASSVQDVKGHMEAVVKNIPSFNIEGKVDLKLSDKEKALTEKFSCKFYGDFILESNPATFKDAVQTYVQLPKLLRENKENGVPLKVWLMPLNKLYSKAAKLISGISVGLVRKTENALEDLREIGMRCDSSLVNKVGENFLQIRKELRTFQKCCGYYESFLQQTMAEKLPSIRNGKEKESSLGKLFEDRNKSPFSHDKLTKWMDGKEREINVIRSCVDTMEGPKIVPNQNELDNEVLAPGVVHALCFVFTSLGTADPYLDAMTKYLDSPEPGSTTSEEPWYFSNEIFIKMREKAKAFNDIAKAQKNNNRFLFLIAAITNEKYTGATVYHYKDGILVNEDAPIPHHLPVEDITDRHDLICYTTDLTLDPNTANNKLTLSEGNKKVTYGEVEQSYPDHPERFDQHRQVLCREGLTGRHYWEVEWSTSLNNSVCLCVAYKSIDRQGENSFFGRNPKSWYLGKAVYTSALVAAHIIGVWSGRPPSDFSRVGVYLDWPAGTLSFYTVSSNTLSHIYTFHTEFTEPVYPGFVIYVKSSYAFLSPVE